MSDLLQQVVQPQKQNITTFIYMLIDPITGDPRYVGKANVPLKRYKSHLFQSQLKEKNHKNNWLRGLLAKGERPYMMILEEVPRSEWQRSEKKWIAYFRSNPTIPPLTNSTDGGDGAEGWTPSEEQRKRMSLVRLGKPMPPGTGAKISAANRGRTKTKLAREHFSSGQRKRWQNATEEEREIMLKNLRYTPSETIRRANSERARSARRQPDASSKYRNVVKVVKNGIVYWKAGCIIGGKQVCIGFFRIEEEAARARDRYVLKYIGEHVILNFPREEYEQNPSEIVIGKKVREHERMHKDNTLGYKGIYKNGKNGWAASINYIGKKYRLGTHRTRELAARAYDRKAIEFYGPLALTNFPIADYD